MDYKAKRSMGDDVLWFVRVMAFDVFKFKIVMVIMRALIVFHSASSFIQLYFFLREPNLFPKYGSFFMGLFYTIASGIVVVWKRTEIDEMWNTLERWDNSNAGPREEMVVKKSARRILLFVFPNTVVGLITGLLFAIPGSYDEEFFFVIFLLLRRCFFLRKFSWAVCFLYKVNLVPLCYAMLVLPYLVIYTIFHAKFQLRMNTLCICNINSGFNGISDRDLLENLEYQTEMKKRLKFCVQRHIEMLSWGHGLRRNVLAPVFALLVICGYFLLLCVVLTIIMQLKSHGNSKLMISWQMLLSTVVITSASSIIYFGQHIQDEVEKIEVTLTLLKWYTWNLENLKFYLLAQKCFLTPFQLRFSRKYVLNYDLAVGLFKGLYSVTSVFVSTKKR